MRHLHVKYRGYRYLPFSGLNIFYRNLSLVNLTGIKLIEYTLYSIVFLIQERKRWVYLRPCLFILQEGVPLAFTLLVL